MPNEEIRLTGGNASGEVVRIGDTVRKPWTGATPSVQRLLTALRERGLDVPRPAGRDERGRQVLEYVPGPMASDLGVLSEDGLRRVGRMIRTLHDACAQIPIDGDDSWDVALPVAGPELVCHHDLAPWNLVAGERWVFIDWDGAGPSTRLWDLQYAAQSFAHLVAGQPVDAAARRLAALVDGYDGDGNGNAELRALLPAALARRTHAMAELLRRAHATGDEPWATVYVADGAHWHDAAAYVTAHTRAWSEALSPNAVTAATPRCSGYGDGVAHHIPH